MHTSVGPSMNETVAQESVAEDGENSRLTAGALLREARTASGVHIAALAVALKVPVGKLEALESDDFSTLPDIVFVRALASSVCRSLKLDPQPVLALLPQGESPRLSDSNVGLNAPVKVFTGKSSSAAFGVPGPKPVAWAVGVLLIGAALMVLLPRGRGVDWSAWFGATQTGSPVQGAAVPAPVTLPASVAGASTPEVRPVASDASPMPPAVSAAPAVPVALATESQKVAPAAATDTGVPLAPASAAGPGDEQAPAGLLSFRARSESWIQVREATGGVVLQRKLASNETVSVSGALPLAVVVGRADATEVFVRGKPYELAGVSRENVARFEVK